MSDLKPIVTDDLVDIFLRNTEYATLDELKEATDKKIMEWMHKTFPDRTVTFSIMDGVDGQGYNRIDFSKVIEQEDLCRECKEKGNFIRCLSGGYLWDVEVTRNGRFRVAPRMCGLRRTAIEDRERAKQKPKEPTIQAKKWWGKDHE